MRWRSQVVRIAATRSAVHAAGALGWSGAPSRHISTYCTPWAAAHARPSSRRRRPPRSTPIRSRNVVGAPVLMVALLLTAAERGLTLLAPGLVAFGLVLGELESRKVIEIDEGSIGQIGDIETCQQRFLREARGERRQGRDVAGHLEGLIHDLAVRHQPLRGPDAVTLLRRQREPHGQSH